MVSRKDTRLRTIQRDMGKVFIIWFGIKYVPPPESQFKVGDELELIYGTTMEEPVMRRPKDGLIEKGWKISGFLGGEKSKDKAVAEWEKFLSGGKSHGLRSSADVQQAIMDLNKPRDERSKPERPETAPASRSSGDPNMSEIRELAKDYEFDLMVRRVVVRFPNRNLATSFKIAAVRRGWKVSDPITDENTGVTEVLVQEKP